MHRAHTGRGTGKISAIVEHFKCYLIRFKGAPYRHRLQNSRYTSRVSEKFTRIVTGHCHCVCVCAIQIDFFRRLYINPASFSSKITNPLTASDSCALWSLVCVVYRKVKHYKINRLTLWTIDTKYNWKFLSENTQQKVPQQMVWLPYTARMLMDSGTDGWAYQVLINVHVTKDYGEDFDCFFRWRLPLDFIHFSRITNATIADDRPNMILISVLCGKTTRMPLQTHFRFIGEQSRSTHRI